MQITDLKDSNITERVRQVLIRAKEEARTLGSPQICSEHILLGMLALQDGVASSCLQSENVTYDAARNILPSSQPLPAEAAIELSDDLNALFKNAAREARVQNLTYAGVEQLLLALIFEKSGRIGEIFAKLKTDLFSLRMRVLNKFERPAGPPSLQEMLDVLSEFNDGTPNKQDEKQVQDSLFVDEDEVEEMSEASEELPESVNVLLGVGEQKTDHGSANSIVRFTKNLTQMAKEGKLDPVIGRQPEIHRVMQVLCRRTKNNAILLGEAGVGKTAIVEGIAQAIASGQVPDCLKEKNVVALDTTGLIAGTKYRGQFEARMKKLTEELCQSKNIVLFIDEIHTIVSAGNPENGLDISNILKPALARGELQCIGATTPREYHTTIEKDSALERRFQPVQVNQPGKQETLDILEGIIAKYQEHHSVIYSKEVLQGAIDLSERYLPKRKLPDKVIDVIDEAGAALRLKNSGTEPVTVTLNDISTVIAEMAGLPAGQIQEEETEWLLNLEKEFSGRVIGQDQAITAVCRSLRRSRAELKAPGRPIGSFLFLGPSGVGKTLLAHTLAQVFFHSSEALVQLDMSEYSEAIGVTRLVGATPGYVGYSEGGQLTEKVKHQPSAVVLFDEVEKAHPDVINLLLQILEEGKLTDGSGTPVNFANTVIILTSNVGSNLLDGKALGFGGAQDSKLQARDILKQARKSFRPELLDRLDECIVFNPLTQEDLKQIVQLEISQVEKRLQEKGGTLRLEPEVTEHILELKEEQEHGARALRRRVQRFIEDALAEQLIVARPSAPFTAYGKLSNEGSIIIEIISSEKEK